jgi:hypothetical protein
MATATMSTYVTMGVRFVGRLGIHTEIDFADRQVAKCPATSPISFPSDEVKAP